MAYILPHFNLFVNVWRNGNATSNPPDGVYPCNLTPGKRFTAAETDTGVVPQWITGTYILLPPFVDIRGVPDTAGAADTAEVPAGSGRFYQVYLVEDIGKGFLNEHRFASIVQRGPWPHPIP